MGKSFPIDLDFLELVSACEAKCEDFSLAQISKLGEKLPQCHRRLAAVLSLLYREACCFDGCDSGDHIPQRIAARVVSHALAAYRLLARGYYDESLSLARSIGEAANLLFLFALMPEHFARCCSIFTCFVASGTLPQFTEERSLRPSRDDRRIGSCGGAIPELGGRRRLASRCNSLALK